MKRILFVCAVLSALTACKEQKGDTVSPTGIIIEAVTALSQNRSADFNQLLSGVAAQKYSSVEIQKDLLKSLGDVRKITLGTEKILSHDVTPNVKSTVSTVDVIKSGNAIYTVITRCDQVTTHSSHTVCPAPPAPYYPPSHDHDYYPPSHHNSGGGYGGGHSSGGGGSWGGNDSGSSSGGGYITPGVTHEVDNSSGPSDDGHKPGNNDPDRPPRFGVTFGTSVDFSSSDCYEVPDSSVSVSCKIIDLQ